MFNNQKDPSGGMKTARARSLPDAQEGVRTGQTCRSRRAAAATPWRAAATGSRAGVHNAVEDFASAALERIPEPERLVPCASDDGLAVGAHGEVQHSRRVTRERGDLCHGRVPPDMDLI